MIIYIYKGFYSTNAMDLRLNYVSDHGNLAVNIDLRRNSGIEREELCNRDP
jgi:hypothetical protein